MGDVTKGIAISLPPAPPPGPGGAGAAPAARTSSSSPPDFASDLARLVALLGAAVAPHGDADVDVDADVATTAAVESGDPVDALCAEVALAQPGVIPVDADPDAAPSSRAGARTLHVALTPPGAAVATEHRAAQVADGRAAPVLPLLPAAASAAAAFTVLVPTQETPVEMPNADAPDAATIVPLNMAFPAHAAPRAAAAIAATPVDLLQPQASRQIAETVTWHVPAHGAAEVRIRLNPEALGPLDVQLRIDGDKVSVRFDLGDERVRDVVQSSLPSLSSMLAARGLQLDQAQVFAQARGQGSPQHPAQSQESWSSVARDGGDAELSVTAVPRPLIRRGLLDDYA